MGNRIEKGRSAPFPVWKNVLDFLVDVCGIGFDGGFLLEILNFTVWTNQNADAGRVFCVRTFARAISEAHGAISVAKQRKTEGKLLGEVFVLFDGVETDAQNLCVFLFKFVVDVAEPATLDGSSRGVGFGIKP